MSTSSLIDWLAIGSWTAATIFQTSTAIRDGWKSFRGKRMPLLPYQRILRGESINGWRQIIPSPADGVRYPSDSDYYFVTAVVDNQDPEGGQGGDGFSLDFWLTTRLLDGREICHIRRYSRLRPCSTLLLEMIYDRRQCRRQFSCYLDSCTVATTFKEEGTRNFKIVFLNVMTRKVRQLMIEAPDQVDLYADFAYISTTPKYQLHVIYVQHKVEDGNLHLHIVDTSYDLPPIDSPSQSIIRPSSWESISVPIGNRSCYGFKSFSTLVHVLFDSSNAGNAENHTCVSIDTKKNWRIDTMAAWQSSFQNTKTGASVLDAIRGLGSMFDISRDPPLYCHKYVVPLPLKTEILMLSDKLGALQHRLAPMSLKRSAVEVVCKVNPEVKMSVIKEATGVDVSDGIGEDGNDRGDCQVIYV